MILNREEADARLNSNDNLINRLRRISGTVPSIPDGLVTRDVADVVSVPGVDDLVEGVDDKLNTAKGYKGAKEVLAKAVTKLNERLIEVDNPSQLASIAVSMGKLINGFDEQKQVKQPTNIIIFKPAMNDESRYETVLAMD